MNFIDKKIYDELWYNFLTALILQREVRKLTDNITNILEKEIISDYLIDELYNPLTIPTEEIFKELLLKQGLQINLITSVNLETITESENNNVIKRTKTKKN